MVYIILFVALTALVVVLKVAKGIIKLLLAGLVIIIAIAIIASAGDERPAAVTNVTAPIATPATTPAAPR